jgi:hypothetical protein
LISSCETKQIYERCTHLGKSGAICTDKRLDEPPKDCERFQNQDHSWTCKSEKLMGYQCTNPKDFEDLVNQYNKLKAENERLKDELEFCD